MNQTERKKDLGECYLCGREISPTEYYTDPSNPNDPYDGRWCEKCTMEHLVGEG